MTQAVTRQDIERALVERDLIEFLGYVYIPDPPPAGVGLIAFDKWPHILRLHEAVESVPSGGILPHIKARKLGVTSYFEARFVWVAQYQRGAFLPVVSQAEL